MSWFPLTRVRLVYSGDVVSARIRAAQSVSLFGDHPIVRSRFASDISTMSRHVVSRGAGKMSLVARVDPPSLAARFSGPPGWCDDLPSTLHDVVHEGGDLVIRVGFPVAPRRGDLQRAGAHLAHMGPATRAGASLVGQNERLLGAMDELEAEARETARLATRLELQNKDLELFAAAASHDLKEPMLAVSIYVRLLRQRLALVGDEDVLHSLDVVETSANQALSMLHGLAAYRRLTATDVVGVADLDEVMTRLRAVLEHRLEACSAELIVEPPLHRVAMRVEHAAQVFQNLVANSLKFCDDEPRITVSSEMRTDGIHVSVRDNGVGIPEEQHDWVFRLFARSHPERPGSGVGLAVVSRLVTAAGGRIELRSTVGVGTCVTVVLPPA